MRRINKLLFRSMAGVTLVELMVALSIGLFLSIGIVQLFSGNKSSYRMQTAMSRVQENGRFALDFLTESIRGADFWGCQPDPENVVNHLNDGADGYIDFTADGITGLEGGVDPDTLILRGAVGDQDLVPQPPYGPSPRENLFVNVPNTLAAGDILLISDCMQGDIFQISSGTPSTSGTVVHNSGAGSPGNTTDDLSKIYREEARIFSIAETRWFVQPNEFGEPSLWRSVNGVDMEMVEGIEDFQILYGVNLDPDFDSSVDAFIDADLVADMQAVVSLRVSVTVRSGDNVSLSDMGSDRRIRRTFDKTIAIRNRLP